MSTIRPSSSRARSNSPPTAWPATMWYWRRMRATGNTNASSSAISTVATWPASMFGLTTDCITVWPRTIEYRLGSQFTTTISPPSTRHFTKVRW